jgi:hypothetical protein
VVARADLGARPDREPAAAVWAGRAALMPDALAPRYLLVVRRDRPEVFAKLHGLAEGYVHFVRDRRRGERRAQRGSVPVERRAHDRRRDPPSTWTVLGFVLHREEAPRA